jgi:hypothetical protein
MTSGLGRNTRSRANSLKDIISKKAAQKWARCDQKDFVLGADFYRQSSKS